MDQRKQSKCFLGRVEHIRRTVAVAEGRNAERRRWRAVVVWRLRLGAHDRPTCGSASTVETMGGVLARTKTARLDEGRMHRRRHLASLGGTRRNTTAPCRSQR